jgi:hypothetical protein
MSLFSRLFKKKKNDTTQIERPQECLEYIGLKAFMDSFIQGDHYVAKSEYRIRFFKNGMISEDYMRIYVGVTDSNWYEQLSKSGSDEVNFWTPSGRSFKALKENELFLFKLAGHIVR